MRTTVNLIGGLILAIAATFGGAAYQNHKDAVSESAYAGQTVAILGVVACGRLMGAVTVEGSGKLVSHQNMTEEAALAVSKTLPEANAGIVTIPCPQGVGSHTAPGQDET